MIAAWLIFQACPTFVFAAFCRLTVTCRGKRVWPLPVGWILLGLGVALYLGTIALLMQQLPETEGQSLSDEDAIAGVAIGLGLNILSRALLPKGMK